MSPRPEDEKTEIRKEPSQEAYPCLEIIAGPRGGGRFPLRLGKNQIGRSGENDVVLPDSSVSRRHAVIDVVENGATLTDLGSRNGTKVAGRKIDQPAAIEHDARIKVGLFQLRFLLRPAEPVRPEEVALEEVPPPSEPHEAASGEVPLPAVPEEAGLPAEYPPEEAASQPAGRRSRRWILYLFLGAILVVTLIAGGPQLFKWVGGKRILKREKAPPGKVGGVLPAKEIPTPPRPPGVLPVFLDFSSAPIPAQVFFGDREVGVTPFRISTNLGVGKWYEARGVFQLPEVGEVIEEKAPFTPPQGATVIPIHFAGKIGIFKVAALPRDAQLYLEGYFERDPYRAKPIKFAEIVFGKPVYVPFGRYILELRRSRQLGMSQTYLDEVVYRREFYINNAQTTYTVEVKEETLAVFPVQVTSVPPGAKVFVDDREVGVTPYTGSFPVGQHLLTLKREGYFDFIQMIKMEINMPYVAEIPLKTSEAGELINRADLLMKEERFVEALPILAESLSKNPSPRETAQISYLIGICYLRQKSFPEAQSYFLKAMEYPDYKFAGRLGIASLTYEQGDAVKGLQILVEVLVSSEDPKVRADAGALFQKISPLKSVMYITSEPTGARVIVNGTEVSQVTPMILHDLGVGSYRLQIRKEGYDETEMKMNLGVSEFRPVVVKLKKGLGYGITLPKEIVRTPETTPSGSETRPMGPETRPQGVER